MSKKKKNKDEVLRIGVDGGYDHFKFVIKIDCKESELDGNEINSSDIYTTLLHEYTHYLQSMVTVYGAKTMNTLFKILINLIVKSNKKRRMSGVVIPLKDNAELWSLIKEKKDLTNSIMMHPKSYTCKSKLKNLIRCPDPHNGEILITYLWDSERERMIAISLKTIRESMAVMACYIFRGIGKDVTEMTLRYYEDVYCVLFRYFRDNFPSIGDTAHFVYRLCEVSLSHEKPTYFIGQLIEFIEEDFKRIDFLYSTYWEYWDELIRHPRFRNELEGSLVEVKTEIDLTIIELKKHARVNDFYRWSLCLFEYIRKGLVFRMKFNSSTLVKDFRFCYIREQSKVFGSPLIFFNDGACVLGEDSLLHEAIQNIFALVVVFEQLMDGHVNKCPFHEQNPFCEVSMKPVDICERNCLEIDILSNDEGCLLYNSLVWLGVKMPQ